MKTTSKICMTLVLILQLSSSCFSQDSLYDYTDREITELTNYIANLRAQNSSVSELVYNEISKKFDNETKNLSGDVLKDLKSVNNDREVFRLTSYITHLTKTDSTAETAIIRGQYESIALIILNETIKKTIDTRMEGDESSQYC